MSNQQQEGGFDLLNFKGMFFENEHQKYTCPNTGAHFEPKDLCRRLNLIKTERENQSKDNDLTNMIVLEKKQNCAQPAERANSLNPIAASRTIKQLAAEVAEI